MSRHDGNYSRSQSVLICLDLECSLDGFNGPCIHNIQRKTISSALWVIGPVIIFKTTYLSELNCRH